MGRHYHNNDFLLAKSDAVNAIPTIGVFVLGQFVLNNSGTAGALLGWRCTVAGQAEDTPWVANTAVGPYALVYASGNVYRAGATGGTTGTVAPSHTTGNATDGTVTWTFINKHAQFDPLIQKVAASADTATAPGATYTQAEVQAILDELRDLKSKLRTAGILTA